MSEEKVFVTADCHFNHPAILKHCNRPFKDIEEMDEYIIEQWNSMITKKDHVYIVGDFAFKNHKRYIDALNGRKHLIIGSHDEMSTDLLSRFVTVSHQKLIKYKGRFFCLSHCPLRTWEDAYRGNVELHGHLHGRMKTYNLSFDIGMDTHEYKPYNMDEVLELVKEREDEMRSNHRIIDNGDGTIQYYQDDVKWLEFLINKFKGAKK